MPTEKEKAASRANGAQSPGPKTPEGKARSSQNARTHGFCSNIMTIPGEDHERFHILLDAFVERFNPIDLVELDLDRFDEALEAAGVFFVCVHLLDAIVELGGIHPAQKVHVRGPEGTQHGPPEMPAERHAQERDTLS